MANTVLTKEQQNLLSILGVEPQLRDLFYLTGGTCLSEYYLHHRYSEDLDFFSINEIDTAFINTFLKSNKDNLGYVNIDFQQSFNRNLFFLNYNNGYQLKVEFTYFPFPRIDTTKSVNGIQIDSLIDITVNKLFTVYQKPRGRDFYDLYSINEYEEYDIKDIISHAKAKFDTNIDLLQLGRNIMLVKELKDDPLVVDQKYNYSEVVSFFENLASNFKQDILI